ncbi:MAG: CTP synthase [Chloroflexi bacterium]|nr:CTP synthase [Chloroflexota bacterium]MDA1239527.1 CTP synthase [Chloroflexota bacterium]MQC25356.1 CTP synthase [Chloroflexota bacterium]MQC47610.1 CTP synthase [Chloroflexota bacterium]
MARYIFVTGGVVSSVGKGIVTASLGRILKARGLQVSILKLDPYINVDPGTMSPYQHGEVFVTDDGAETDLDLGHYERFTDIDLAKVNSSSSGQIYEEVIRKERRGDYLGGTIQAIPHVTNEIKRRIRLAGTTLKADVVIVEVGGTVGDIEGQVFLEAISQMRYATPGETLSIHVTLLPYIGSTHELKTKPTQHSVRELRSFGIQPDVIIARSDFPVPESLREKVALFCSVQREAVIPLQTADSIYEVPLILEGSGLGNLVTRNLGLGSVKPDLEEWAQFVERLHAPKRRARIALVGKYVELHDAYLSIKEALVHAGVHHEGALDFDWVHAEELEGRDPAEAIGDVDGILLCPGFGDRGLEGKINAVRYARERRIPYLGDCLGLQMLVVEFARHVAGMPGANTTEADPKTPWPVISLLSEQQEVHEMGGTMRLGGYDCRVVPGTKAAAAYGADIVRERHRHRYEVNNALLPQLVQAGLVVAGRDAETGLVEIVELPDHPFMVGAQFHPEFTSRPNRPNALFRDFVGAAFRHAANRPAGVATAAEAASGVA